MCVLIFLIQVNIRLLVLEVLHCNVWAVEPESITVRETTPFTLSTHPPGESQVFCLLSPLWAAIGSPGRDTVLRNTASWVWSCFARQWLHSSTKDAVQIKPPTEMQLPKSNTPHLEHEAPFKDNQLCKYKDAKTPFRLPDALFEHLSPPNRTRTVNKEKHL